MTAYARAHLLQELVDRIARDLPRLIALLIDE
jgi:hypothetical protein